MPKADSKPKSEWHDLLLECPICLDAFTDPVVLACDGEHMLCRQHVCQLHECPKCRGPVGVPRKPSQTELRMLSIARAGTEAAKDDGQLEVFVNFVSGRSITLYVDPSETVYSVKVKIHKLEGIDPTQQRLVHGGKCLDDGRNLSRYGIRDGSSLHVVLRARGGLYCDC